MFKIPYARFLVYFQPLSQNSLLKCAPQPKIAKLLRKTRCFKNSRSFKVINVGTPVKLVKVIAMMSNACL